MEKKSGKVSLTIKSQIWGVFSANCYKAGMTPSRVVEVFMLCMIDPYPTDRLQKFVTVANTMRKVFEPAQDTPKEPGD